jgi:hypothetical protein
MTRPIDDIATAIQTAISNALKENKDLFTSTVNVTDTGAGGGTGGGSGDIVGIITELVGLGIGAGLASEVVIAALGELEGNAGSEGLSFTIGYFLASTLLGFADPVTRQLVHKFEALNTSQILDPAMAADMVARGIVSNEFGEHEAAGGGFDRAHFSWMLQAAYTYPAMAETLQMWNRGIIGETDVDAIFKLNGIPDTYAADLKRLHRAILSPADWALAALRGNVTNNDAIAGAAEWGLSEDDFKILMLNTGEPPGTMQLLEAYRRGFIDEPTLAHGIRQSRVRDEWIPTLEKLRYAPMSTAAAANAVTRGFMTEEEGARIAQDNGLEPAHWLPLLESNGRPPSHEQLAELYHRGIIDLATFEQGIRESDIKDKYISDVVALGVKLIPLFEARTLLNAGEITGETFTRQMLAQGYEPGVIAEITKAAGSGKPTTAKHLSVSDYTTLYDAGVLTRQETKTGLESIGYSESDAESIITVADVKAQAKIQTQQVTNVRTQFDRYRLTDKEAQAELQALGIGATEAAKLTDTWKVTRPDGTRFPTEAQTMKFLKDKLITVDDALQRLRGMGYTQLDAELLVEAYG